MRIDTESAQMVTQPRATTGKGVGAELPDQVEAWLAKGKRVAARTLREKSRCRHWNAGGFPAELTSAINSSLLDFALRDKIKLPRQRGMMSVLSGELGVLRPAAQVGLKLLHVDWQSPYVVGPGNEVTVNRSKDVRQAPRRDIVSWVCKRQKCSAKIMALLALVVPCHTWTTMEHANRHRVGADGNPTPCNYREGNGSRVTQPSRGMARKREARDGTNPQGEV